MRAAGATVGPIYSIADVAEDIHFREREIIVALDDPELGPVPTHNVVPRLSATPGHLCRPAPRLGEHSREVLAEAGLAEAEIAALLGSR
jgi:crotonobetainyl-CoA:carnitine CoA-transferase CaiB-like acyl-CoA transferase